MKRLPILLLICAVTRVGLAAPLGTAFTFSGRMNYQNKAANGSFDLQLKLYDTASAGNQFGPAVNVSALQIVDGLFVTTLDFGPVFNGTAYWLEIAARPNGGGPYTILSPRQAVNPAPYALFAANSGTANAAHTVNANSVGTAGIQNNAITGPKIAANQVVKSLNGLTDIVSLNAGAGVSITPSSGNVLTVSATGANQWSLTGNAGTTPGVNFLGTTDNQPLELKVNNSRMLRLEWVRLFDLFGTASANVIGGLHINRVFNGAIGATISGGGEEATFAQFQSPNEVGANFGTISGGSGNRVLGLYGTVAGGSDNEANGLNSFAAGNRAKAAWDGSFVWADSQSADFSSSRNNEFAVRAAGGVYIESDAGIRMNAADRPLVTRGWDPFDSGTGPKDGHGRWGLFMEYAQMVLGIPDSDVPGGERTFAFGRYHKDGSYDELMTIRNTDGRATFNGDFVVVTGNAGEQAYLGGDGIGNDVQFGSLNPNVTEAVMYNAGSGRLMNTHVATLTIHGGADLAEPFPVSDRELEKGSVMVIDEDHPGRLKRCEAAYDTRVAGVLSGANGIHPGIALKQNGVLDQGENVALSGRVYVLADAAHAPIKPGDLLTTSDTPGHAMKVTDHARAQGAILGKAMSSLSHGKGLVLVLVTLQ